MDNNLSYADVAALQNGDDGMGVWNNPFVYLIWIYAFRMFGGGLFGDNGNGALTRAELNQDMNLNNVQRSIDNLAAAQCDCCCKTNTNILETGNGIQQNLLAGFAGVNAGIADARYAMDACCCTTNRNIDSVKADNYQNTCAITNAIHAEGEATRALITDNTMQNLRDRLADKDRELLTANLFAAQEAQTQNLINSIKPCAIPAYLTCSPYTSLNNGCGCGYTTCGCGCASV